MTTAVGQSGDLEKRVAALEQAAKPKTKDLWDKAKVASGFLSSVVIAALGLWINSSVQKQLGRGQLHQTLATIQSERERSETDIRSRMFEVLMKQYFTGGFDARRKVMLLELLEKNFQDLLSAGPLFALAETDFTEEPFDAKKELRKLAKELAESQEVRLGAGEIKYQVTLGTNQPVPLKVGDHHLIIELISITPTNDHVTVTLRPDKDKHEKLIPETTFGVSYFDMPLVDNTHLSDDHRLAVTLKDANHEKKSAVVKIFEFGRGFVTARERPHFGRFKGLIEEACTSDADCKPGVCASGQCDMPDP
jgi:hypothetical protein